jgi:hypothetical protein
MVFIFRRRSPSSNLWNQSSSNAEEEEEAEAVMMMMSSTGSQSDRQWLAIPSAKLVSPPPCSRGKVVALTRSFFPPHSS